MLPTTQELQAGFIKALGYYYSRVSDMKKTATTEISMLRSHGISFADRTYLVDKINWCNNQLIKIKHKTMPAIGDWVDGFPIGEWSTNGLTQEENIYNFIIKRFELCYLTMDETVNKPLIVYKITRA